MGRYRALAYEMLGMFVLLEAMLVGAILYWPDFETNIDALRSLARPIPALRDQIDYIEETGVLGYILGQHFFKGCNTLGSAAAVLFAVGAVAGEVHRGTLEILLARPYSRARILTERYVAGLAAFAVPVFATSATIPWLAGFVDEVELLGPYLWCALYQVIFLATIYSATFFLSAIGSHPTRIAVVTLFTTTLLFAIYFVKVVTHWSFFRLADIEVCVKIADRGGLPPRTTLVLLGVSALLFAGSLAAFRRRVP